jgi:hypothetical protein
MLKEDKTSMKLYMWHLHRGDFRVETRRVVREGRFDKYAKIPVARFILAIYFIIKDDAFLRPLKPDPSKPMFYRRGLWKVHNCGQRKDGTYYTSGNAAIIIIEEGKETFDSSKSDLPYSEIKAKWDDMNRRLRDER